MSSPDIKIPPLPPPAPDLADIAVRDAADAKTRRGIQGSRRRSFLTGASSMAGAPVMGVPTIPQVGVKQLLGT